MSLYDLYVPPMLRGLSALSKILDKAAAHAETKKIDPSVFLAARLYPDMYPLTRQVQIVCDMARRGAIRLAGGEPPSVPDTETTVAELKARIAATIAAINAIPKADFDRAEERSLTIKVRGSDMVFSGLDFVRIWSLPNFYFHLTTAYAILRHNGVELGKPDFLAG
ncbi:MAG TPA: DUF1993 domain-containing protein [Albidovulum sp.]|uniref:DUF1993 domain-containing protein n=1 Tax=Albidovulum sp. TaxID=1872424 RepID=UPI002C015E23|nr:DUF1993 domain-containing protein [Albidovulum sp.]